MGSQTINNQRGEIEFRKQLAKQHVSGEMLLPDYYAKEEHDKILLERMNTTISDIKKLEAQGIKLSPFVELGAERGQRALVLANDFNAEGFAVDISFHQLKTAKHFAQVFNKPRLPIRVCCDVNNLPFRDNSFPFAFCYEFLHHFPSPKPILKGVYRILTNGVFYFNEEPFKRPKLPLYKQRHKIYSKSTLRKSRVMRFIESFISEEYCDEREYGILENDDISMKEWRDSIAVFDSKKVEVSSLREKFISELGDKIGLKNLPNLLLGGGISGVCRKENAKQADKPSNLLDLLACPNCLANPNEKTENHPPLKQSTSKLECTVCGSSYPIIDDIILLFKKDLFEELYPDFAGKELE